MRVEGLPWLTEPRALPPDALASRILCDRHNEALSELDTCALKFFNCVMTVPKLLRASGRKRDHLFMFSGPNLERWMIKVLAGMLASGNSALANRSTIRRRVPQGWLEVMLGRRRSRSERDLEASRYHPECGTYRPGSISAPCS